MAMWELLTNKQHSEEMEEEGRNGFDLRDNRRDDRIAVASGRKKVRNGRARSTWKWNLKRLAPSRLRNLVDRLKKAFGA